MRWNCWSPLGLIAFFVLVRLTLSVEKPKPRAADRRNHSRVHRRHGDQIIGHGYERFQAFVTCIFLFVIVNNLLGLIPGVPTPTADPVVPLGIAVLTFLYYNFHGLREQGFVGYLKHFAGPLWWIAPLLFPIEIISHLCAHDVAHHSSLRQHVRQRSGHAGLLFARPDRHTGLFLGLHAFVSLIQAYVFMLLAMIYLSEAVAHEH